MSTAAIRRRLERLEARRSGSAPEIPKTVAERITRFLQIKYIQDCEPGDPPEPFDWSATYERVRKMIIERSDDPDLRY